ncbi:LysR family transcriptional regulator [Eubacterium oxidoreducens]|uniref:DNA-binding transcriptional regulator, LysR family n=1 Tax=Eubacterium oxidoreducens TaxID=1732 RepID=A0A1G6C7Y9_EUBOX|nr:LysR family transcriptional regulator [Eubacterium oxidoreducens]SDB28961.1 DNA-binding transcriptional regulator, LysR family [Eubacterium oxidoreducens]
MEIKQLEYFVQIVDCGTFSAAAQKNFITQSALSKIIKKLENELGTDLLYSQGKNTIPTDTGKILYLQAKKILHECSVAVNQIEAAKGNPTGSLRISVSGPWNRLTNVYHMITDFVQRYPDIVLDVERLASNIYRENLTSGNTDIAIVCGTPQAETQFERIELLKSRYYLLMPDDHPLAAKDLIFWEDILDVPLALFPENYQLHQLVLENFHKLGKKPNIRMTSDQPDLLLHVAAFNHWCTIWGDQPTIDDEEAHGMKSVPMDVEHVFSLLRRNEAYGSQAERTFIEFVKSHWDEYKDEPPVGHMVSLGSMI